MSEIDIQSNPVEAVWKCIMCILSTDLSVPGGERRVPDGVAAWRASVSAAEDAESAAQQTEGMITW